MGERCSVVQPKYCAKLLAKFQLMPTARQHMPLSRRVVRTAASRSLCLSLHRQRFSNHTDAAHKRTLVAARSSLGPVMSEQVSTHQCDTTP
jgi:hypothetical protein